MAQVQVGGAGHKQRQDWMGKSTTSPHLRPGGLRMVLSTSQAAPEPGDPTWTHGALQGQTSEGALILQQASAWSTHDVQLSTILVLFDCTNAFACTKQQDLTEVAVEWFGAKDAVFVEEVPFHPTGGESWVTSWHHNSASSTTRDK
jgi:hypothetical protein